MSGPIATQPDLEAFVWSVIKRSGVTMFNVSATSAWPNWQVGYLLQVDIRSQGGKAACRLKAEAVRAKMLSLPDVAWDAGVITYIQAQTLFEWLPDQDGLARYSHRFDVRCHPVALIEPAARRTA